MVALDHYHHVKAARFTFVGSDDECWRAALVFDGTSLRQCSLRHTHPFREAVHLEGCPKSIACTRCSMLNRTGLQVVDIHVFKGAFVSLVDFMMYMTVNTL